MNQVITFLIIVMSSRLAAQVHPISNINISLPASPNPNTALWTTYKSIEFEKGKLFLDEQASGQKENFYTVRLIDEPLDSCKTKKILMNCSS